VWPARALSKNRRFIIHLHELKEHDDELGIDGNPLGLLKFLDAVVDLNLCLVGRLTPYTLPF